MKLEGTKRVVMTSLLAAGAGFERGCLSFLRGLKSYSLRPRQAPGPCNRRPLHRDESPCSLVHVLSSLQLHSI